MADDASYDSWCVQVLDRTLPLSKHEAIVDVVLIFM